ncbi:MAG: NAD(P)/FAD-dependent oxidoreductase [Pseudomonadota bacterium]
METDGQQTPVLDLLVIGAGFAGLGMAIKAKQAGLAFVILERAAELGGTWRDNRYPGCACDTQSHHYSFSFAPNPGWSRRFAGQAEILDYLKRTAERFGLAPHLRFNERVVDLAFDESTGLWSARSTSGARFRARFVASAVGQLNQAAVAEITGLDGFSGRVMHTAQWDPSYAFEDKRVAVIGSGASAIQLIPALAERARELLVFQRSPTWIFPKENRPYASWEKALFRALPPWRWLHRASIYWSWERSWPEFLLNSRQATRKTAQLRQAISGEFADRSLAETLTPDYPLGCKRILLAENYYSALQRDNVTVVTEPIARIEDDAIVTRSGTCYPVEAIAMATGFKSHDFMPGLTITGRDGKRLGEVWSQSGGAEAYLGLSVPGFPNFFMLYGPNTNLGHNSIIFMIECQIRYILAAIAATRRRRAKGLEVTEAAMAAFYRQLNGELARIAWSGNCNSWYKTAGGKIINNWSTDTPRYWWRTRRLDLKHYRFLT